MSVYSSKLKTPIFITCIILAPLACFGWFYFAITEPVGFTYLYLVLLYLVTAFLSSYFTWLVLISNKNRKDINFKEHIFLTSIISLIAVPVAMYILSSVFLTAVFAIEKSKFEKAHLKEKEGNSSFYRVQQFAKKYYNAPLVLGGYEESWAHTNLYIPQSSPASLRSGTGYCTINFSKSNMQYMYTKTSYNIPYDDWEMLIFSHEFSHCLDRASDLPVGLGEMVKGMTSLAPIVRKNVKLNDIHTFLQAEESPETQLWREAFADVFAVGFMAIEKNGDINDLRDSLINYRNSRKHDTTHYTTCWLEYSKTIDTPRSAYDLREWANKIRIDAPCKLKF